MKPEHTGRTRPTKPKRAARPPKRKQDNLTAEKLEEAISGLDPNLPPTTFTTLPLSAPTLAGLKAAHFSTLTSIQAKAIPLALRGRDILGAAKTGSGKTLAFLIPVLENLFRAQCIGPDAGVGAMIISPTRELAIQIFEVLKVVGGKGHLFAAGLVIGGKGLREEKEALARTNLVVCTPGRILQHLSQTAGFEVDGLKMLVLDEADRIMDMGFQRDVDAILEYLPAERQTLLFSATQTKRVSDLSRLALKNPEYISVHETSAHSTPQTLQQNYTLVPLPSKIDTLFSFLQSTKKAKLLVFLSSGKQVRFLYETFRHLQPGIPLLHLHGKQKQTARLEISQKFARAKHSCLVATDVVARGLDFPAVDWVVQVDCPEDAETYIHRVGRTARFERAGRAVLFLDPSEEAGMLARVAAKRVPVERIDVKAKKQHSIRAQLQKLCFQDPSLKYLGQRAFASYVRSLHVQRDKEVFKLGEYDLEGFAASLGLPGAPRVRFLKADVGKVKRRKNASRQGMEAEGSDGQGGGVGVDVGEGGKKVRTKYDRMFERRNQDILTGHYAKMVHDDDDDNDGNGDENDDGEAINVNTLDGEQEGDDALFEIKRRIPVPENLSPPNSNSNSNSSNDAQPSHPATAAAAAAAAAKSVNIPGAQTPLVLDSNRRARLIRSKKNFTKLKAPGEKIVFDDEGLPHPIYELQSESDFRAGGSAEGQRQQFLRDEGVRVREADGVDKGVVREKKQARKERRREREKEDVEGQGGVRVVGGGVDAFADFVADARAGGSGSEREDGDVDDEAGGEEGRGRKRRKKWFEDDETRVGKVGDRGGGEGREIETLGELEEEALRVLG